MIDSTENKLSFVPPLDLCSLLEQSLTTADEEDPVDGLVNKSSPSLPVAC
jgi:hypothetical protein